MADKNHWLKTKVYVYLDPRKSGIHEYKFKGGVYRPKFEPFYVGCAKYNHHNRHLTGNKSSDLVQKRIFEIRKYDKEPIVVILKIFKSRFQAHKLEEKLIIGIGRKDLKTGPLVNLLDGSKNLSKKRCLVMKEKCRLKSKNLWKDDEYRKKISKRRKNTWKNLAYRANQSKIHAGENNPSSKLTNVDVILIRKLWEIGFSYLQLHNEFKISGRQIKRIVFRESWRHVA